MLDYYLQVYQNGVSRDYASPAYQASWQEASNNATKDIKDGASLDVAMGYVLENTSDPVEIEVQEYVNYSNTWSFSINLTEGYNSNSIEVSDEPENPQTETQAPEQTETAAPETEIPETEAQESEATESDILTSGDMIAADAVIYPAGQYKIGVDMNAGEYVMFAEEGESGNFKLSTDANGNDKLNSAYFDYDYIINVSEGEYLQLKNAYAVVLSDVESLDLSGPGMFKVGSYLAPGEYKLIADEEGESGHYAVYTDTVTKDYIVSQYFDNSTYVEVNNGEYLYLSDCHIENPVAASDFSNPDEENEPIIETELETELITETEIQTEEDRTVYAPDTVLTGTIVEATMNTITVQTDDGAMYLCATEDTEFNLVNGGITLGMEVEVTLDDTASDEYGLFTADYVTDMAEDEETEALETETELVTEPEIQTEEDRTVYAPDMVLTGTIVEATMNTITLQTDDDNIYICATEDTEFNLASGGISLGMEAEVTLDDTTSDEYGLFQAKTITETEYTDEDDETQSEDEDMVVETQNDYDEEKKGSRMNPYDYTEGAYLGRLWNGEDYVDDVTIKFDKVLSPEELEELYPDETELYEERRLVLQVTVETGAGTNDDYSLFRYLEVDFMGEDMKEHWAWIYDYYDPNKGGSWFYTHDSRPAILVCGDENSYDELDVEYIRFGFFCDDNGETDEQTWVWVKMDINDLK